MDVVCHIITKLELGGAQEVALYAVSHLDRSKYRPVLIAGPGGLLTDEARRLSHVDVHILPELGRSIRLVGDLAALVKLTTLLRRLRPTVVHTHSSKAGILGRWAAWMAGVPVIVHTIHGYGITPAQPRWLQRLLVMIERFTGWITTYWIAVSQADIRKGRSWGLFHDNVVLVRPGIDPQPFQRAVDRGERERIRGEFGAQATTQLVGSVACFKPQKAPEDFIAVAHRVITARPDVRFVLVGDGELRPRVEALIARYGIQDRVHLAGWRRDVPAIMQVLDTFLLTSHWEGLPRVLLEARAVGVPVVATNVGGADEVIVDQAVGELCQAGDIQGLADAVVRRLSNRTEPSDVCLAKSSRLPQEFYIDETVRQYEQIYEQLLTEHRTGVVAQTVL
ncbi:MAG: glycosyltransferase family 4 protein [Nitrospira sp.]|nr:glycosyltransferase family 4 protein [Nitrospira sp.]